MKHTGLAGRQARRNRGFFGFGLGGGDPDAEAQRRLQQLQDLEVCARYNSIPT